MAGQKQPDLVQLSARIATAYVAYNRMRAADIPDLVRTVHRALASCVQAEPARTPPIPIEKSITRYYLVSLEDGKRYKYLTGHLSARGLTPASYREKWGLPLDYPMVAPGVRSEVKPRSRRG